MTNGSLNEKWKVKSFVKTICVCVSFVIVCILILFDLINNSYFSLTAKNGVNGIEVPGMLP